MLFSMYLNWVAARGGDARRKISRVAQAEHQQIVIYNFKGNQCYNM